MSYRDVASRLALLLLLAVRGQAADEKPCIYNGETFENESFRLNGNVCQQCKEGKWVDRGDFEKESLCQKAKERKLGSQLPLPNKHTHCQEGSWFSNGAYFVSAKDGKCKQCSLGSVAEKAETFCTPATPAPKQP